MSDTKGNDNGRGDGLGVAQAAGALLVPGDHPEATVRCEPTQANPEGIVYAAGLISPAVRNFFVAGAQKGFVYDRTTGRWGIAK